MFDHNAPYFVCRHCLLGVGLDVLGKGHNVLEVHLLAELLVDIGEIEMGDFEAVGLVRVLVRGRNARGAEEDAFQFIVDLLFYLLGAALAEVDVLERVVALADGQAFAHRLIHIKYYILQVKLYL